MVGYNNKYLFWHPEEEDCNNLLTNQKDKYLVNKKK